MKELHLHLHLDRELLADPEGSIHIHLKPEGRGRGKKRRRRARLLQHLEPSGCVSMTAVSGREVSGVPTEASGEITKQGLPDKQLIRSKMYRLDVVPSAAGGDLKHDSRLFSGPDACSRLILELATGNQVNPIVWESCDPASQRGLWRFSVRADYGRLLGIVTHARDQRAIWVVSDWTPRGTLILEPAEPQCYPRLMLTPVSVFSR
jgi:hypothetical protein